MTMTDSDPCTDSWAWTLEDRREAIRLGVSAVLIDVAEHACELEAGHDGPCVCGCGTAK
jgi:hypothetical protein